jgi:hypothetical protein
MGALAQSATVMVTELMTTSSRGRSWRSGTARAADQEELAAIGVGAGVGHGHRADLVAALHRLVREAVAGAAAAGAGGVAALAHEAVDDAVEDDAVVVVLRGQEHEAVHRDRCIDRVERDDDRAERGLHGGGVALRRVDAHLGRLGELLLPGGGTVEGREGCGHVAEATRPHRARCGPAVQPPCEAA